MTHKLPITRRRMLQISAAAGGMALIPAGGPWASANQPLVWRGIALGAPASIKLYSPAIGDARKTLERAIAELRRLEGVFSLYLPESALSRLNRHGELRYPPLELVGLFSQAKAIAFETGGAFDPTIQPLWVLYAEHFARTPSAVSGPPPAEIARVLGRVDYRAIELSAERIAFRRRGMAASLNGIAQGYITDRVADILREAGFGQVLIDLGEPRALGTHPSGRPWRVGVRAPDGAGIIRRMEIIDKAVATSAPLGTPFEPTGRFHHLLDPRTGESAGNYESVTVTARNATLADGFSTAFSAMAWDDVLRIVRRSGALRVDALGVGGEALSAVR